MSFIRPKCTLLLIFFVLNHLPATRIPQVVHTYEQQLSLQSRHLEVLSSTVQANSSYELTVLQMGSNVARVNVHIDLQDKKANCTLHGLTLVSPR